MIKNKLVYILLLFLCFACQDKSNFNYVVVNNLDKEVVVQYETTTNSRVLYQYLLPNEEVLIYRYEGYFYFADELYDDLLIQNPDTLIHVKNISAFYIENKESFLFERNFNLRKEWEYVRVDTDNGDYILSINNDDLQN